MTEEKPAQPEDPRDRFRRLLDEAEKIEKEASAEESQPEPPEEEFEPPVPKPKSDYPSTYLDLLGREPEPGEPVHEDLLSETRPEDVLSSKVDQVDEDSDEELIEGETLPHEEATTPPPPSLGTTPQAAPPALDTQGMPLPRRVDEIDMGATRVTPSSFEDVPAPRPATTPPVAQPPPPKKRVRPKLQTARLERGLGCLLRMSLLGAFVFVVIAVIAASIGFYVYWQIANDLPDPSDLRDRVSQFETTRILDRNGNLLYEILDPTGGRRTYIPLEDMSPYLVAATIATEDKEFYNHPGFDAMAIVRAFWQNLDSKETVSGASTITQQLTRTMFLSAEERAQRTYRRKLREAILAAEITRRYTKNEILEIYLNENFYGNLAYGVEAASQTYFGVSASDLDLGQAAFLAGLPQLPSIYDVYTNRDVTLERQQTVLLLMFQTSQEQGCISVGNSPEPVCVEASVAAEAARAFESYEFRPPLIQMRYPHWVNFVRSILEAQYDPQTIYRSGFTVHTTLDPGLQDQAQDVVTNQVNSLADRHVTNGALVVIRPSSGEILAMVGSADFDNEDIDGQVNMAVSPRQPGSAIKPLTYIAAFEKGWTPSTLLWDVKTEFPPSGDPNDPRDPYVPVNYDNRYHGPMTVRTALANSINVAAVKSLDFVKIYDDPATPAEDGLVAMAKRLGITTLTRDDYGLSLTLGGGDVSLLELSSAYAVFANGGRKIPPVAITRIDDHLGEIVYQYEQPVGEPVLQPEHTFLISSILSDNEARTWMFGANSPLNLPFQVAAKTGTTNDFRDNWTIGYTPDVVVGTWVGNADYTPMQGTSGLTGAAPIWNSFMQAAVQQLTGGNPTRFMPPTGVVEQVICSVSGTEPSQWCPKQSSEYFVAGQPPLPSGQDLWQKANIDTWTGLLASPACKDFTDNKLGLNVKDPWAVKWIKETDQGRSWAKDLGFDDPIFFTPQTACAETDSRPILEINSPSDGVVINSSPLSIYGRADATSNYSELWLQWGRGNDPVDWDLLREDNDPVNPADELYEWDVSDLEAGVVSLRLRVLSTEGTFAEKIITLDLQVPTSTPTPTDQPTATFTSTATFTPTLTSTATLTSTPTFTPTNTLIPSDTPTATSTDVPTETLTETLIPSETPTLTPSETPSETPLPSATPTP